MLVETKHINGVTASEYDSLLAGGWFRSREVIYRADLVCMDERVSSVRHIRYSLENFSLKKRHRKLLRKNDERFVVRISPVCHSEEAEELYAMHTVRFKGFIHRSLNDIVFPFTADVGFSTIQLDVYDMDKLVAVSFFDVGKKSAASILCVYDESYSKHSLGIYTMLKEMEYLREMNAEYYYPGYVLDRASCFDYKLSLGQCQWMGNPGEWHEQIPEYSRVTPAMKLEEKMSELRLRLALEGYMGRLVLYPYFTAAYLTGELKTLVKYPCYFLVEEEEQTFALAYDFEREGFVIFYPYQSKSYQAQYTSISPDYLRSSYEMRIMECIPYDAIPYEGRIPSYQLDL